MKELFEPGKVVTIVDSAWGSSAKGKVAHYLTLKYQDKFHFVISQCTRNASHTIILDNGVKYKFVHLPVATLNPNVDIIIGGDATIELDILLKEIEGWKHLGVKSRLYIHPNAAIITEDDKKLEQRECRKIASTMTGTAGAKIRKILRNGKATLAKDISELRPYVADVYEVIMEHLKRDHSGLLEGSQGFDLSIDHGGLYHSKEGFYPYTTSRNVDPLSFLGSSGIPKSAVGKVIAVVRTFPIRVGDGTNCKVDGLSGVSLIGSYSGGYYPDQEEVTWEFVTEYSGCPEPIFEKTALTNRPRRVFTFSKLQWKHFTRICQPDAIFITFADYLDHKISNVPGTMKFSEIEAKFPKVGKFIKMIEDEQYWKGTKFAGKVYWISTGSRADSTIEVI